MATTTGSPSGIVPVTRIYNFNRGNHRNVAQPRHGSSHDNGSAADLPNATAAANAASSATSAAEVGTDAPVVGIVERLGASGHAGAGSSGLGAFSGIDGIVVLPPANMAAGPNDDDSGKSGSAVVLKQPPETAKPEEAPATAASADVADDSTPGGTPVESGDLASTGGGQPVTDIHTGAITPGPPPGPAQQQEVAAPLYLEVFINGVATNLIAEFTQLPGGGFAARAKELEGLGITPPANVADDELVALKDIGAETRYDEEEQKIDILLAPERLRKRVYDLANGQRGTGDDKDNRLQPAVDGIGMVLNYSLLASARAEDTFTRSVFDGVSAQLEGWIYSPMGTVFSSGLLRKQADGQPEAIRLDTYWQFVDVQRAVSYRVGDAITSGPAWARAVRLGGIAISRSFKVRPDVIATPLPSLSGTAAVPTTVDVYVNNLKVHSGEVAPGPFEITNIPALSQGGVARLVMRDAAGREIVREQSFYVSPRLLRADLFEFSLAAGAPRRNFGSKSFDYDWKHPGIAASMRYGLSNQVTLQAHAEAARDLILGGGGINASLLGRALVSASGAVSHSRHGTGYLAHASAELRLMEGLHLSASSTRTWGEYVDLAALSALRDNNTSALANALVPRAVESLNLGYSFSEIGAAFSAGLVHVRKRDGERTLNLNLGYSQQLWKYATLYANALIDLDNPKTPTLFAGFTMPLGDSGQSVSASGTHGRQGGWRAGLTYDKPLKSKDGAVGWRARVTYGDLKSLEGSLAWRTPYATVRGSAMQVNEATVGRLSVEGALVLADGALFAANRINESFAIVNAGAPGVRVRYENREVGTTRGDGRLLIPSLRSLQRNKVSIDAETLPVDAMVEEEEAFVVPGLRAGVVVDFKTRRATQAALVILHDANGEPIAPGAEVKLAGAEETFVVGYDGETYLDGLRENNTVEVITADGTTCRARFRFHPGADVQPRIGPVVCRP